MRKRSAALRRNVALLTAALAVSAASGGAPVEAEEGKKHANQEPSWLSPADHQLLRRSYLRCLSARYARIGNAQREAELVAAFNRDLEHFSLLISPQDLKAAPKDLVSGGRHIRCEWFDDGSATAR